ncbi:MAG: NADPH-dependent FMN reductase [Candidatus Tectimicrobiota bacterium]
MQGIVCISGTNRPDNYTARALGVVVEALRQGQHAPVLFDARTLSLPFPGQADSGDGARLRQAVAAAPGVILATPEYHGSFCAMTKLIIENLGFPSVLAGKPVALVGVAAGRIGAIKALEHLKSVCGHVGALVVPGAVSIAGVQSLFDEQGRCTDATVETMLRGVSQALLTFLQHYVCPKHILEDMVRHEAQPWATTVA